MQVTLDTGFIAPYNSFMNPHAGVAQLVERLLPKQNVVGSSPITRLDRPDADCIGCFLVGYIYSISVTLRSNNRG